MIIHVLGAIDPTTHYGLEVDHAIKINSVADRVPWAMVACRSVLGLGPLSPVAETAGHGCRRVVARSGRLVEDDSGRSGSWGSWSPRGKAAFESEVDRLAPVLSGLGIEMALWPNVGEALSDVPSCLSFLRRYESGPYKLLIEPAALLAESMVPRAGEHMERILDSLAEHPGVAAMLVSNVEFSGGSPACVSLVGGLIPRGLIDLMVSRASATARPLVVRDRDDLTTIAGFSRRS